MKSRAHREIQRDIEIGVKHWLNTSDNDPFDLEVKTGEGVQGRREVSYRGGPVARLATPAPSVSVPAAASPASTTAPTTPRRLAVVVPVPVSFLAGAVTAVFLTGHVHT